MEEINKIDKIERVDEKAKANLLKNNKEGNKKLNKLFKKNKNNGRIFFKFDDQYHQTFPPYSQLSVSSVQPI